MVRAVLSLALTLVALAALVRGAAGGSVQTIVYDGKPYKAASASINGNGLWISVEDLAAATGFHIKPQGVCRDELCFPLPARRKAEFVSRRGGDSLFNLVAFASLIGQPVAHDEKNGVWLFGERAQSHESYLETLEAPNFSLPDASGKTHSLSEYRGKKVMLLTWASW